MSTISAQRSSTLLVPANHRTSPLSPPSPHVRLGLHHWPQGVSLGCRLAGRKAILLAIFFNRNSSHALTLSFRLVVHLVFSTVIWQWDLYVVCSPRLSWESLHEWLWVIVSVALCCRMQWYCHCVLGCSRLEGCSWWQEVDGRCRRGSYQAREVVMAPWHRYYCLATHVSSCCFICVNVSSPISVQQACLSSIFGCFLFTATCQVYDTGHIFIPLLTAVDVKFHLA